MPYGIHTNTHPRLNLEEGQTLADSDLRFSLYAKILCPHRQAEAGDCENRAASECLSHQDYKGVSVFNTRKILQGLISDDSFSQVRDTT